MSWWWLRDEYNLNDIVMGVAGLALGMDVRLASEGHRKRWVSYGALGEHSFCTYGMRLPIDNPVTIEQANDKVLARMRIAGAGVATLPFYIIDGYRPFFPTDYDDWTLKVSNGKQGGGVVSRVPAAKLAECVAHLSTLSRCLLLEPTLYGPTYRFLVLDGEVIDAFRTAPARLVADGRRTVSELFTDFTERISHGYGIRPSLDFEARYALGAQGLEESDVLVAGQSFHSTFLSNISRGGEWVSLNNRREFDVHARVARAAAGAVGLRLCGVDMIESSRGEVFVLEANPSPGIARFTWPWRPDFRVETLDLRVPLSILAAVLRAIGRSSLSSPEFVRISASDFNEYAMRLLNLSGRCAQETTP